MIMDRVWIPVLILAMSLAFVLLLLWLKNTTRRERTKMQMDLMNRAFDRFSSAKEFIDFLNPPSGQRLLLGRGEEMLRQITGLVIVGIVGIALGVGLAIANVGGWVILVCTGIGLLVAAAAVYLIYKRQNIIGPGVGKTVESANKE